jgi:hypothetical protein
MQLLYYSKMHFVFNVTLSRADSNNSGTSKIIMNDKTNKAARGSYTGCPGRNVKNFGRVFLMLKYTDITQNTYIQS